MNTVKTPDGIEIYTNEIYRLADEYINSLDDPTTITKSPIFRGMLKYIYLNLFRIRPDDIKYNNKNSRIDYNDIDLLNGLWDVYTGLCYKYLQSPTILNFSIFTGIDTDTINTWRTGEYRGNGQGATSIYSVAVKRWQKECEAALYDGAATGNPGPMFLLKSNYGYTEQPQKIEIVGQGTPQMSAEELLRLRQERQEERRALPEKPDL